MSHYASVNNLRANSPSKLPVASGVPSVASGVQSQIFFNGENMTPYELEKARSAARSSNIYGTVNKSSIKMCIASNGFFSDISSFLEIIGLPTLFNTIYTRLDNKLNTNRQNISPNVHNLKNEIYSSDITQFMGKKQFIDNEIISNRISNRIVEKREPFLIYIDDNPEILLYNNEEYIVWGNYEIYENNSDITYNNNQLDFIELSSNNTNLDIENISNFDFIVIRLPKDKVGLQEKHMKFIKKMIENIRKKQRDILMVFDFDCTITKNHLTIASGKAKSQNAKNKFRSNFIRDFTNNTKKNNPTYNNVLKNFSLQRKLINYFINQEVINFLANLPFIKYKRVPPKTRPRNKEEEEEPLPPLPHQSPQQSRLTRKGAVKRKEAVKIIPTLANLTVNKGKQVNKRTRKQRFFNFVKNTLKKPFKRTK